MDSYVPTDVTEAAQAISRRHAGAGGRLPRHDEYGEVTPRVLLSGVWRVGWGEMGFYGRLLCAVRGCSADHEAMVAEIVESSAMRDAFLSRLVPRAASPRAAQAPARPARRRPPVPTCRDTAPLQCTRGLWHVAASGTCASRRAPGPASSWTKMSWT